MKMLVTPQPNAALRFFTNLSRTIASALADSLAERPNGVENHAKPWILYVR